MEYGFVDSTEFVFGWAYSKGTLKLFKKIGWRCFKVKKHLFLPFTKIWLTVSLFSIIFFPSALTFVENLYVR